MPRANYWENRRANFSLASRAWDPSRVRTAECATFRDGCAIIHLFQNCLWEK